VLNELRSALSSCERTMPASPDRASEHLSAQSPAVIITGPPWPRGGAARVIQNQIAYYRNRGFFTVFIAVPFHWSFISLARNPEKITEGLSELGADRMFTAILDQRSYNAAKYKASIVHAFRGTLIDWEVAIGRAAHLSGDEIDFLRKLRVVLFHVNHVYTLEFALSLRRRLLGRGSRAPFILETHDVQSQLVHERGRHNPWTRRPDALRRLVKSESTHLKKADALIHLSVDDFKFLKAALPSTPQFLALPTIDEEFRSIVNAAARPSENIDLLFVGQEHLPNLAAMRWFLEKVWPVIAERHYNVKIVGPIGPMVQRELPQLYDAFRSFFVGEVVDLVPFYRAARCVIAPMVSGSGTSIKTIEALALGKPFVGTSKAFRGMPMERLNQAGIQAHDEPQSFADAISRALSAEGQAGAASRAAYDAVFSARASFAARDAALQAVTIAHHVPPLVSRQPSSN
jgi:glycosyltransferase involved in cell wall biosynthesis